MSWVQAPLARASVDNSPLCQYMSDLHLEIGQQYLAFDFDSKAPNLVLAGDIGRLIDYDGYLAFLQKQTTRYKRVFLVLGNYEFYRLSFESGVARARDLEQEPSLDTRLFLLHQSTFVFQDDGIAVMGCPLWSFIAEDSAPRIAAVVNDFKKIDGWSIAKHNAIHSEDLNWLRQKVQTIQRDTPHAKVVVLTHHAPPLNKTASPEHKDSTVKTAFATDVCDTREYWLPVKYWVFGHTHWTTQLKVNGIQVVSNQRGYVFSVNNVRLEAELQPSRHTFDTERTIQI